MKAVNLLPDARRRSARSGAVAGGAYAVIGVLAVLLVMVLAYTVTSNQASSKAAEAAAVKQQADQAEARAKSLGAFGNFTTVKNTRFASVKTLAAGRFDFERMLRELGAVFPRHGWIQDVKSSTTGTAAGNTAAPAGKAIKPTLELTGCLPKQHDVAALMVRLHRLYLAEDVTLKESVRSSTVPSSAHAGESGESASAAAKPTFDSCGSMFAFDVTVTFSSSAPTGHEAPPNHSAVPAKLGGGS
jgi:Tfp pilus assembly protein PilN